MRRRVARPALLPLAFAVGVDAALDGVVVALADVVPVELFGVVGSWGDELVAVEAFDSVAASGAFSTAAAGCSVVSTGAAGVMLLFLTAAGELFNCTSGTSSAKRQHVNRI